MSKDDLETLAVLTPRFSLQIVAGICKLFGLFFILRTIQLSIQEPAMFLPIIPLVFIILLLPWALVNTIDNTITISNQGILQRGFLWKTYIGWDAVKTIELSTHYKKGVLLSETRYIEICADRKKITFNNKISFNTSVQKHGRIGIYYVLKLAEPYNVHVKTSWWSPPYAEWKAWAATQKR